MLDDIDRVVERVLDYWEDDRRTWALNLAARLAADPARVAHKLALKKQGAEHMIGLWEGLAKALESQPDWDEEQRKLASDLLGVRPELRSAKAPLPPAGDTAALAALAAKEIERLRKDVEERLEQDNESAQFYTLAGMPVEPDALTKLLERYRKGFRNEYDRALAELLRVRGAAGPGQARPGKPYRSPNGVPPVGDWDTAARPNGAATAAARESGKGQGPHAAASPVEETHAAEDVHCTVAEQTGDAQDASPDCDDEDASASASASERETGTEDLGVAGAEESEIASATDENSEVVFATAFAAGATAHERASTGAPGMVAARSASFAAAMPLDPPLSRRARKAREKRLREAMKKQRRMNRSA